MQSNLAVKPYSIDDCASCPARWCGCDGRRRTGQLGETVIKGNARKVRRLANGNILVGFAGATADAFSLLSRFETKLEQFQGQLERAAIELSKDWRTDKYLRHLEALLIVADKKDAFLISGKGDVISSDEGLLSVGSGSMYALAAARALMQAHGAHRTRNRRSMR